VGDYRHRLSLSADHNSLDLSEIPLQLGMPANRLWNVGEIRVAPNGRVQGGTHRYSFCSIDFESSPEGLPRSLEMAVSQLQPHKDFLRRLHDTGVNFRFFIGWFSDFNSADRFEWKLLRDIADLRIALDFDFYGPNETQQKGSS
jgi:hypothetical protein